MCLRRCLLRQLSSYHQSRLRLQSVATAGSHGEATSQRVESKREPPALQECTKHAAQPPTAQSSSKPPQRVSGSSGPQVSRAAAGGATRMRC